MAVFDNKNRTNEWMRKSRQNTSRRGWITKSIRVSPEKRPPTPTEIAIKEDRECRNAIRDFIIKKHKEGKSSEEILKRLNFVFGSSKYAKYRPYYKTWVDNVVNKDEKSETR